MKILSFHKSAFERQIREAVLISEFAGPKLLNSKLEYNRSLIPQLSVKLGPDKSTSEDPDVTKEKSVIEKIKLKYKSENKRQVEALETNKVVNMKRMKLDEKVIPKSGNYNITTNYCSATEESNTQSSSSEISPITSSNTYNLCNLVNPHERDKFAHKFTLNPAKKSPNCGGGAITMPDCNNSEKSEEGRHLWSIFDTKSQVEETKDPKFLTKKTPKDEDITLENRRHLWSEKTDTQSQMDKTKSPVRISNKGKVKSIINGIENYKRSPLVKRKLVKKYSPTLVHKDRKKIKEKSNDKSPNVNKKKMEIKTVSPDRNTNRKKIEKIIENFENNIQLQPKIEPNKTEEVSDLKLKKDAFKILMESPGCSMTKSSKFKKERRKKSLEQTPTRKQTRMMDTWLRK